MFHMACNEYLSMIFPAEIECLKWFHQDVCYAFEEIWEKLEYRNFW